MARRSRRRASQYAQLHRADRRLATRSRLWFVTIAIASVTLACAAADVPEVPADDAQLVEGRALWASNCVNCHGSDGGGGVGTKLNEGALLELYPSADEQRQVVVEGRRAMPAFGAKFTDEELDAVLRYTREIIAEGP